MQASSSDLVCSQRLCNIHFNSLKQLFVEFLNASTGYSMQVLRSANSSATVEGQSARSAMVDKMQDLKSEHLRIRQVWLVDQSDECTSDTCPIKNVALNSEWIGENLNRQLAFMDECLSTVQDC